MPGTKVLTGVRVLFLQLCSLLVAQAAWGWGPQGHEIVAAIAQDRLAPRALEVLRKEFNITRLEDVANWADRIKRKRKETRPWHYTNIPQGERQYLRERDCPQGACVTEKIEEFSSLLRDKARPRRERREAVMFLVHFIADVHQPLHLGNPGDRGGNEIRVRVHDEWTNLHAVWDHDLIRLEGKSLLKYAAGLSREITPRQVERWNASSVVDWSEESRELALEGYRLEKDKSGALTRGYLDRGRRVVKQQLKKAGVRLAHRLNLALQ